METKHSDIIVNVYTKNQIIDFSNNLIPAQVSDYANLQGIGGKKHAASSGIRIGLTDKSTTPGTFVSGQVSTHVFECIKQITLANMGEKFIHKGHSGLLAGVLTLPALAFRMLNLGRLISDGKKNGETDYEKISAQIAANNAKMVAEGQSKTVLSFPTYTDYTYSQTRVNPYAQEGGYCQCSTIQIEHKQYRAPGSEATYPWMIRISNFSAKPKEHENGTLSYVSSTVKDSKSVTAYISNDDMHKACYRIEHFVRVWENVVCEPLVAQGLAEKETIRRQYSGR